MTRNISIFLLFIHICSFRFITADNFEEKGGATVLGGGIFSLEIVNRLKQVKNLDE